MPTVSVNLSTTEYVKINTGLNPLLLQSHRDDVRIVLSDAKPAFGNSIYHTLGGDDELLKFDSIDVNVWVLATTDSCSLVVSETDAVVVTVGNVVDVSETDLTFETDVVTVLNNMSCKLSTIVEYWALFQKIKLEGE